MPRTATGMSAEDAATLERLLDSNTIDDVVLALANRAEDYHSESNLLPYGDFAKELREAQVKLEHHPFWKTLVP